MKKIKDLIIILKSNPQLMLLSIFSVVCVIIFIALIVIILGNKPTGDTTNLTEAEQIEAQGKADEVFNRVIESTHEKYPWFDSLPPKNEKYFVAFDEADKAFYVSLYSKNNPSLTENYKKQLYLDLQKIGIATESYGFNFFLR